MKVDAKDGESDTYKFVSVALTSSDLGTGKAFWSRMSTVSSPGGDEKDTGLEGGNPCGLEWKGDAGDVA